MYAIFSSLHARADFLNRRIDNISEVSSGTAKINPETVFSSATSDNTSQLLKQSVDQLRTDVLDLREEINRLRQETRDQPKMIDEEG